MEALTAGGNVPDNPDFDLALGQILEQAEDPHGCGELLWQGLGRKTRGSERTRTCRASGIRFRGLCDGLTAIWTARCGALRRCCRMQRKTRRCRRSPSGILRSILRPICPCAIEWTAFSRSKPLPGKRMDACMAMPENTSAPLRDLSRALGGSRHNRRQARPAAKPWDVQASTLELAYGTEQPQPADVQRAAYPRRRRLAVVDEVRSACANRRVDARDGGTMNSNQTTPAAPPNTPAAAAAAQVAGGREERLFLLLSYLYWRHLGAARSLVPDGDRLAECASAGFFAGTASAAADCRAGRGGRCDCTAGPLRFP